MSVQARIDNWILDWRSKGYFEDIPDEVPDELMKRNLAPSYKQIALAILSNDMQMESLGYSLPYSKYYGILKRIEIEGRRKIDK